MKKYGFKVGGGGGGVRRTILGVKGGHKKIPSSFAMKASVIMQTAHQNAKNQHV